MADGSAPSLIVVAGAGDTTTITLSEVPDDWRAKVLAGKSSAELAAEVARTLNAHPLALRALRAVRTDCRDPDTDTALAPATGELVEAALAAMEGRS